MDSYAGASPDLYLVAIGVVIWVVAVSVAFGFYIPVLRNGRETASTPLAPPARAKAPAATVVTLPVAETPALQPAEPVGPEAISAASVRAVPAPDQPVGDGFSVLVVDDNAVNRQVLEMILDSVGVSHASVENGLQAVEAVAAHAYDAVLMDLQMPVMDGFEATRRIRALEATRGACPSKIIVVSANCLDEHVTASHDAGADDHIAKPISAATLIGALEACAASARIAA
jgi:CheY-like chemotaxis protein